ncbi:MAG: hypothetical protein ACE141_19065 [Bryobacteraceae bacterium]
MLPVPSANPGGAARTSATTYVGSVPTDLQRQGDFSQTRQANGQPITIYDPLSTRLVNGAWVRDPFAGNRIPSNRIDPVAAKILPYWPAANQPGTVTGQFNYVNSPNSDTDAYDQYALRIDQQLTSAHKLMGRWVRNVRTQTKRSAGFPTPASPPGDFGYQHWRNNSALPFFSDSPGPLRHTLGGWQTNFILRAMTGTLVGAPGGAYSSGVNPKLSNPTMARWFNTCTVTTAGVRQNCASPSEPVAWIQQPPFTLRTLGPNLPGIRTSVPLVMDFSLFKDFAIYERLRLQFRAEAFNLANTPMFGGPNTSLTSAAFGQVTPAQANDPRIVQLALRLMF